jgi:LmbE family N-acetylglucosaminyl deacetylase
MKNPPVVMVFAAHPDDEVLGVGGTLAKHASTGSAVHIVIMAEGMTSRDNQRKVDQRADELSELARSASAAGAIIGAASVTLEGLPDNRLDSIDRLDLIKIVERHIADKKPEIVYTHHSGDVNVDHRRLHEAVITACRPQPGFGVKRILCFETASSTEWQPPGSHSPFLPNWFVDISDFLEMKQEALRIYASEMRDWPHPRSHEAIDHLAKWRGATVGAEAAEAFILMRNLD